MGVIQEFVVPPPRGAPAQRGTLDCDAAEAFLRSQCAWLREGLQHACEPPEVARVLSRHDTCHHSWLALIAAVGDALGEMPARTVATLYAFHGRVAGSLERGPDPLLSGAVCAEVRALLEAQLTELTDAAIAAVNRLCESATQSPREG